MLRMVTRGMPCLDYFSWFLVTIRNEKCGSNIVDMWDTSHPANTLNGSCMEYYNNTHGCAQPGTNGGYTVGPEDLYEEHKFVARVLSIIENHDPATPLFLNYDSHICHSPLQVPQEFFDKFGFINSSDVPDWDFHRHLYAAMVNYVDTAVGTIIEALKAKGMWENTLWVFQSDNGGPSFTGDNHTANNFPLKGAKYTNWEGGIRVNAFLSGPYLQQQAPAMIGQKLEGFVSICDYYATFARLAGQDPTDHRAALAGLPPIDSIDMWDYFTGKTTSSPRTEIFADHEVLLKGAYKLFVGHGTGDKHVACPSGDAACVSNGCWGGPYYPNASVATPACNAVETCKNGGCLYNIFADPEERVNLSEDPQHKVIVRETASNTLVFSSRTLDAHNTTHSDHPFANVLGYSLVVY
eukprot:m.71207 g.71207  ORF g.71207 m.71207 type:complete len:409 (-) comp16081_c0_seq6:39-1265(-)